jgi:hypothetical protein
VKILANERDSEEQFYTVDIRPTSSGVGLTPILQQRFQWKLFRSSAFSRCLREKGLNLLLNFSAVAAEALNPFLVVRADCHCEGETLATLFATIFVKRHKNPPLESLWRRNQDIIALR